MSPEEIWSQPEIASVVHALAPLEVYLVGGAVRDLWLGRPLKDYDFLIDVEPSQLLSLRPAIKQATGATVIVLDAERGILRVCYRDSEGLDLCARQGESIDRDLARRDITFNAMAFSAHGQLLDPFGGAADLAARRVRPTSPQVLSDDPLRVLRCLRLAATLDFELEPETVEQMRLAAPGLRGVAGERIGDELLRFLASLHGELAQSFQQSEVALAIWGLGNSPWSPMLEEWCRARPSSESLPRSPQSALSLLAAILWSEAATGPEKADQLTERIKLSRQQVRFLESWWAGHRMLQARALDHEWTTRGIHALTRLAGESLEHLLEFAVLESYTPAPIPRQLAQRILAAPGQELRAEPLPIGGRELCQYWSREPGPWLGRVLKELESAWACREYDDVPGLLEHSETYL